MCKIERGSLPSSSDSRLLCALCWTCWRRRPIDSPNILFKPVLTLPALVGCTTRRWRSFKCTILLFWTLVLYSRWAVVSSSTCRRYKSTLCLHFEGFDLCSSSEIMGGCGRLYARQLFVGFLCIDVLEWVSWKAAFSSLCRLNPRNCIFTVILKRRLMVW